MKILAAIAQTRIQFGSLTANLAITRARMQAAARLHAHWIVFPELWLHGYDLKHFSEHARGTPAALQEIAALAADYQLTVWGTVLQSEGDNLYNSLVTITPQGEIRYRYRKTHLFRPLREDSWLQAGGELAPVFTHQGISIGPAICYDLRFPELFRAQMLAGAQCVVLPAQWSRPRLEHWQTLLRARAIENQTFVIGVNAVGLTGKETLTGSSAIISPRGQVLAQASLEEEALLTAELDFDALLAWRTDFPVLKDRRGDLYG
ncbi:hypothetical protein ADN00_13665 [Ornatilinea apprima]|uniref:CN hydrolase domain-containing protein n=1 Tax=Ornatilinea apprima TaxID=1134406 RepID=A0A0P6X3H2_9CHLR|nr:nitrilase-related carbon-nitrogen hydrolase [Ornatilinea apprima]KPL74344.1 hypothetical protein ADN00_13665 [Ornatilinea apprima]